MRQSIFDHGDWQQRLAVVMETMREMSLHTDPQEMVRAYARRMQSILPADRRISLSRRDLQPPLVRVTRYSGWQDEVNPWKQKERLPVLQDGLLSELIYGDEPRIIDDLGVAVDDPGAEFLAGQRSLMAIPLLDHGVALNMVVLTRTEPAAFNREQLPELVWMSNLFGRATHNLVLAEEVRAAYELIDRELQAVADIQRSLLPARLPEIPGITLAAHYQTSRRAGGDYYDVFPLADGRWGLLIADVSGHGTPAAVMMAITHSIAHMYANPADPPGKMLVFLNRHLTQRYLRDVGTFVTAFYAVYDPASRVLTYASAGHNPPRIMRCGRPEVHTLDGSQHFPLGISADEVYQDHVRQLGPGDQLILFTDGITESRNPAGEMFGVARLDAVLRECHQGASDIIDAVLRELETFTAGQPAADDRTLLVARVI